MMFDSFLSLLVSMHIMVIDHLQIAECSSHSIIIVFFSVNYMA